MKTCVFCKKRSAAQDMWHSDIGSWHSSCFINVYEFPTEHQQWKVVKLDEICRDAIVESEGID